MLAAFPRTSVYPNIGSHVQKNYRKMGKVSHQMRKIIEDIQGKSDVYEKDAPSCPQRRSHRRKYRKSRDHVTELREMASQTTMVSASENSKKAENAYDEICERRSKNTNFHSMLPDKNCLIDTKCLKAKDKVSQTTKAPWNRPLPPVPESESRDKISQADLYQKVFEILKARRQTGDVQNVNRAGHCHDKPRASLTFSPSKSLSKQIAERSRQESMRYVDIDLVSENRCKPHLTSNSGSQACDHRGSEDADEDAHIYESIDENSDCALDSKTPKREPFIPFHLADVFSPISSTPISVRHFGHDETYLVPMCKPDQLVNLSKKTSGHNNTESGQRRVSESVNHIEDIYDYSGKWSRSEEFPNTFCPNEEPNVQCTGDRRLKRVPKYILPKRGAQCAVYR